MGGDGIKKRRLNILSVLGLMAVLSLIPTCILFEPDPLLLVKTEPVEGDVLSTLEATGTIVHLGAEIVSQHGFCWSGQQDPTVESGQKLELGSRNRSGAFTATVSGLDFNTTYYLRAYATDPLGTVYGQQVSFTTLQPSLPSLTTAEVSAITDSSAVSGGTITDDGGDSVLVRGVCWNTAENPTIANDTTADGSGTGSFTSRITGLTCGTAHYVRAYATSATGTAYGQQRSFSTPDCPAGLPVLSTASITEITLNSATGGGNITSDGGDSVTARGVCWSTSQDPTTDDGHTSDGSGTGEFTSHITGLDPNTTYYVRAYATNGTGTAYGQEVEFTTLQPGLPVLTTAEASEITDSSAVSGGNITDDGGDSVTARGVCWSTSQDPTTADSHTTDGSGTGEFTSLITGLDPNTRYYVRAYATNSIGTAYSNQVDFTSLSAPNTVLDYDGNVYATVEIGYQNWMAENLRTTHYANGTAIPLVEDQAGWDALGTSGRGYCYYDNYADYAETYGALYTWATAMDGAAASQVNPSGVQGVCPDGWHLPSDSEWKQLELFLGMSQAEADGTGMRGSDEGGKLKEVGTTHWYSPNTGATNESGFSALPGGDRNSAGADFHLGIYAFFWTSSTDLEYNYPWYRLLYNDGTKIDRDQPWYRGEGYSVRCVRDGGSLTMPEVTTAAVTGVTETEAQAGGEVVNDGGATVTARGVCWSTEQEPDLSDSYQEAGFGTGTFNLNLTGLECETTFYLRAYATNSAGTAYGNQVNFTTSTCSAYRPTITMGNIDRITATEFQVEGEVTADGGAAVTAKGACWSTAHDPTTDDEHTDEGGGIGTFTSTISGLTNGTDYYVTVYATNAVGTAYAYERIIYAPDVPTVTTASVSNITQTSAQCGGNVTKSEGATVTARGVCWSTSPAPTLDDDFTTDGDGLGSFTSDLADLECGTTYYVRSYATNIAGTGYGNEQTFTTDDCTTVTDYDGNIYSIVVIGTQSWMGENLKTTHYADGTAIQLVENEATWAALSATEKAYCWYQNAPANGINYGALYTWAAATNGVAGDANPSGIQGVCPTGWHLPGDAEFKQLEMYLGMSQAEADATAWRGTDEGGKLKETGTLRWTTPNTGATNESGFGARPGGLRGENGVFQAISEKACFWTSAEWDTDHTIGWSRSLAYDHAETLRQIYMKNSGYSIRCVKDP